MKTKRIRKQDNRGTIEALASADFAESINEMLREGEPLPTNHEHKMIKLHRVNALIMLPPIDNRGDFEPNLLDPHNILEAIDGLGEELATEIYADAWQEILKGWEI